MHISFMFYILNCESQIQLRGKTQGSCLLKRKHDSCCFAQLLRECGTYDPLLHFSFSVVCLPLMLHYCNAPYHMLGGQKHLSDRPPPQYGTMVVFNTVNAPNLDAPCSCLNFERENLQTSGSTFLTQLGRVARQVDMCSRIKLNV